MYGIVWDHSLVMRKKTMFEFTYKGETIKFEGYNKSDAMHDANQMFKQKEDGVWWEDHNDPTKFKWVEGNFFD